MAKKVKKQKRIIRRFVCEILGNMTFRDRILFVFSGNYLQALERTMRRFRMEDLSFVRGASNKNTEANSGD